MPIIRRDLRVNAMMQFDSDPDDRSEWWRGGLSLAVLPLGFVAAGFYFNAVAGPYWQWNRLDPSYFYLLDGLNLFNGEPPGHIAHPGVTVQSLYAVVIRLITLGGDVGDPITSILADPERVLALMASLFLALNAAALWGLGRVALTTFDSTVAALACQLAPFMSTLILKHAILPKPEAFVVLATTALLAVSLLALRPALRQARPTALTLGFAVVAGFGVATKLTAAPIFVLGFFLLPRRRDIPVYMIAVLAAFVIFTLPAVGAYREFAEWVMRVAVSSGAHGAGAATVIDLDSYPGAVAKIFKRPSLRVPMILSVFALVLVWWRGRDRGERFSSLESRALLGIVVAQAVHILFVAKQPAAHYLLPSYMVSSLSSVLALRIFWQARPTGWRLPQSGAGVASALFAVFVAAQTAGMVKLDHFFIDINRTAMAIDDGRFGRCARVYIYAASNPTFAMYLADRVTGLRFSKRLKPLHPANDFWIEDWFDQNKFDFRNWDGSQDFNVVRAAYPCLYMRGNRSDGLKRFLRQTAPDMEYQTACSRPPEMIATVGVDCDGRLQP